MNSPFATSPLMGALHTVLDDETDNVIDYPELNTPPDTVFEQMPAYLRIKSLERSLLPNGKIHNVAVLYHDRCTVKVDWITQHVDSRLQRFGLATIRHAHKVRSNKGAIRIERLLPVGMPVPDVNLFETIPTEWIKDRSLVARAANLWNNLPRSLAHLVNAVLWDSGRFHRFVRGPSSLRGHHNDWNGNFRHSIEVAERAKDMAKTVDLANTSLLVVGGLLHDAAKADEYAYDREYGAFRLSDRGELIGHRDTLIEWLAVARSSGRLILSDDLYLGLMHMINAEKGAPAWVGLRAPRSMEAEILSVADRLSSQGDLHERCAPDTGEGGFGHYHRHIGHRTYVSAQSADQW